MTQPHPYANHNESSNTSLFNPVWITGVLIVLIPVFAGIYYLFDRGEEPPMATETKRSAPAEHLQVRPDELEPKPDHLSEQPSETITMPQPQPAPRLPNLDSSDQEIGHALSGLSGETTFGSWFDTSEIVRKTAVLTDNLARGKVARKYLFIPRPPTKFSTYAVGAREYMSPASYARYDSYIGIINSIDIDKAVSLYQKYSPLLNQAFGELGYPDRSFHQTLMDALETLLKAPIKEKDLEVTRSSVMYKYIDPELEALPAIHKLLLRIGPDNTRRLQQKIILIKTALEQ